jgi:hypothetical protein
VQEGRAQTKALLAKARDWSVNVFDTLSAESVTRKVQLVKECLSEAHSLAREEQGLDTAVD